MLPITNHEAISNAVFEAEMFLMTKENKVKNYLMQ